MKKFSISAGLIVGALAVCASLASAQPAPLPPPQVAPPPPPSQPVLPQDPMLVPNISVAPYACFCVDDSRMCALRGVRQSWEQRVWNPYNRVEEIRTFNRCNAGRLVTNGGARYPACRYPVTHELKLEGGSAPSSGPAGTANGSL